MDNFLFTDLIEIKSHEILGETHLKFYAGTDNNQCGTIDFISEKINFHISCKRNIFKGMVSIKNITIVYKLGRLVFILKDKKDLSFNCSSQTFEIMNAHIQRYKDSGYSQDMKNAFIQ